METIREILDKAIVLEKENRTDTAIDILMENVYDRIHEFEQIDLEIKDLDISELPIVLMITLLSTTFPIADKLSNREDLFNHIKEEIIKREGPKRIKSLIGGLEGSKVEVGKKRI